MKKIILFFLVLPLMIFGQELDAKVTVNFDKLPNAYKDRLSDFAMQVQTYLNSNRYTEDEWEGDKIPCSFHIIFMSGSNDVNYSAQVIISSSRYIYNTERKSQMIKILDGKWSFRYEPNRTFYFNLSNFDPLTSFLDFYALVIIGVDADSYDPFGGNDFFSKAIEIALLGANAPSGKEGWSITSSTYNRRVYVNDLMSAKMQQFRQDFFDYHYNGLDLIYNGPKYKIKGQKNIVKLIDDIYANKSLAYTREVVLKVFFDAKAGEIAEVLADYPDKKVFSKLLKINPEHSEKYLKILEKEEN